MVARWVAVAALIAVCMGGVSVLGFPVRSSNDFATSSSTGCGKAAPYDPATTSAAADFTMTFAGTTRHYLLKLPKSYDQARARMPCRLVVWM